MDNIEVLIEAGNLIEVDIKQENIIIDFNLEQGPAGVNGAPTLESTEW